MANRIEHQGWLSKRQRETDIVVYALRVKDYLHQSVEPWLPLFSQKRQQEIGAYYFQPEKTRTVMAELLIRWLLAVYAGRNLAEIFLAREKNGKPFCPGGNLKFSLSHSGAWVACSLGSVENGVDVEEFQQLDSELVRNFFRPDEYSYLMALPLSQRYREMIRFWTMKESFLKYTGTGLQGKLEDANCLKLPHSEDDVGARSFRLPDQAWLSVCGFQKSLPKKLTLLDICPEEVGRNSGRIDFCPAGEIFYFV